MPLYYIDTFDHVAVPDEEGQALRDEAAAQRLACRALAEMLHDGEHAHGTRVVATVRDDAGRPMLTVSLTLAVQRH